MACKDSFRGGKPWQFYLSKIYIHGWINMLSSIKRSYLFNLLIEFWYNQLLESNYFILFISIWRTKLSKKTIIFRYKLCHSPYLYFYFQWDMELCMTSKESKLHSLSPFKKRNGISNRTTVNNVFTPFISHDLFKPDKNDTKPCFKQSSRPHK